MVDAFLAVSHILTSRRPYRECLWDSDLQHAAAALVVATRQVLAISTLAIQAGVSTPAKQSTSQAATTTQL